MQRNQGFLINCGCTLCGHSRASDCTYVHSPAKCHQWLVWRDKMVANNGMRNRKPWRHVTVRYVILNMECNFIQYNFYKMRKRTYVTPSSTSWSNFVHIRELRAFRVRPKTLLRLTPIVPCSHGETWNEEVVNGCIIKQSNGAKL